MKKGDGFFLLNIVEALNDIIEYSDVSLDIFLHEKMRQDAIQRKFEILGESVKNLSKEIQNKYPNIQWSYMARFRDVLIHHYFGIDLMAVWTVSKENVPQTLNAILLLDEYLKEKEKHLF